MTNTSNLKDTVTTIAGLVGAIAGGLLTVAGLSPVVKTVCGVLAAVSVAIIGIYTGKSPNGAVKTDSQLAEQNKTNP